MSRDKVSKSIKNYAMPEGIPVNFDAMEFMHGSMEKMTEGKKELIDKWTNTIDKNYLKSDSLYKTMEDAEYYPKFEFDRLFDNFSIIKDVVDDSFNNLSYGEKLQDISKDEVYRAFDRKYAEEIGVEA